MTAQHVDLHALVGTFAEDKDAARQIRRDALLPALGRASQVVLDFAKVELATQSFAHALLSEAIRRYPQQSQDLLEFRSCSEAIRAVISLVFQYSLDAVEAADGPPKIAAVDVPHAPTLYRVRQVVEAVKRNSITLSEVSSDLSISYRHAAFRGHAARVLALLEFSGSFLKVRPLGAELLSTEHGTEVERRVLERAIRSSWVVNELAPGLLDDELSREQIASRIRSLTKMAPSTANARAGCLWAWRRQVRQLPLRIRASGPHPMQYGRKAQGTSLHEDP